MAWCKITFFKFYFNAKTYFELTANIILSYNGNRGKYHTPTKAEGQK